MPSSNTFSIRQKKIKVYHQEINNELSNNSDFFPSPIFKKMSLTKREPTKKIVFQSEEKKDVNERIQ